MRRPAVSLPLVALVGLLAAVLPACGEEDARLLPGGTAREITANLETVEQLADEGDCVGAESAALQVSEQVEALRDVDERLQRALREGADRLTEVVAGCEEVEATEPEVVEPETESVPPDDEEREREKLEREREREEERERREEEAEPSLPPQSQGEGKGLEEDDGADGDDNGGESEGESGPSGGIGPATPAGEG